MFLVCFEGVGAPSPIALRLVPKMHHFKAAPVVVQVLRHQPPVAVMGLIFAA